MRTILVFLLFLPFLVLSVQSCKKTTGYSLRSASRDDIKKHIAGKWDFKEEIIGFSQQRVAHPPGEVLDFKFSENTSPDSLFFYVNDTLRLKSDIQWNVYDDWIDHEGTLTILTTSILPFFCVGELKGDNLRLFTPAADGNEFFLTRHR